MKVGIDAHFIGNQQTGNETYTRSLITNLSSVDRGLNRYCLYFTNREAAAVSVVEDARFQQRLLKPQNPLIRIPCVLPWEVRRRPVDVLHTHYTVPPFLPSQVRTVVTIHDVSWEYYPELYSSTELFRLRTAVPWSARRADRILAVSQTVKSALVELYNINSGKIVVTPLAASPDFFPREQAACLERVRERYGIQGRFILYVGNLTPRKNLMRVLKAFAWLRRQRGIEEKLVVAGPRISGSDSFVTTLRELQLGEEVVCTGNVTHDVLPDLYGAAELFVFPSLYEAFGLPTLEAMACGTPVVAANRPAYPEVAGEAALLVDPDDYLALANGIERVLSNSGLREELRAAGVKKAAQFKWTNTASQTFAVYSELAERARARAVLGRVARATPD